MYTAYTHNAHTAHATTNRLYNIIRKECEDGSREQKKQKKNAMLNVESNNEKKTDHYETQNRV